MHRTDIPSEIFDAVSAMVADRYHLQRRYAETWIEDVLAKGDKSVYWPNVSQCAKEFFKPIADMVMPVVKQILSASINAAMVRSEVINNPEDDAIVRHVDDPNGEKEDTFLNPPIPYSERWKPVPGKPW